MINQLETISLHVDIMRETLQELYLPCPVHDLFFAITNLHNAKFDTSIQISFCSATVQLPDDFFWNMLMSNMNLVIKEMSQIGAKAEFSIDPNEGYMDITVQHGKVDYCFAFFYFNPHIFEGEPSQVLNNVNDPTLNNMYFVCIFRAVYFDLTCEYSLTIFVCMVSICCIVFV
ncbi:unnamed protein product [Thelazia callipaeda]|uniref:GOLD domain-containing protein n=1 Tax=Thelazia callipaeda TaxID=103827 RepID=A0A0N5DBG4_THECL|nr:unnamed protein product [Thelazia callipaeda]